MTTLEIEVEGELEHVLERLMETGESPEGMDIDMEMVAEQLLRDATAERYQQLVMSGQ